jgi:hypothetical protein
MGEGILPHGLRPYPDQGRPLRGVNIRSFCMNMPSIEKLMIVQEKVIKDLLPSNAHDYAKVEITKIDWLWILSRKLG